ncbi:hypothetical protein CXG81DRAFT_23151 [Caulochytrium protostelioides]|uniref:Saccharopine dehydrogenase n=1 Tax=Caulochytrium protostelioides TaxID=1555241 RepID=A0A4P9XF77_9FUNG|nr:hypothetical protein CXG81DRAFT_23151 [Caulochytrium protostelioides]|eukprot:RKP04198.1 hypothetical protein CXG81DRAFT_23151 [Caulochytrium protostelioides]
MADKKVLLLGTGYVALPCLDTLLEDTTISVTVASRTLASAQKLTEGKARAFAQSLDVDDPAALEAAIAAHDLTISLIPYIHHVKVAQAAIKHKKHVVTTSYVSPAMEALDAEAKAAGVIIFNEIGLDPGIDHLYAVKTIAEVHRAGGKINGFYSYCGGLPAPECSNNPFGYKFSWSARGVLLALKNTAKYLENGQIVEHSGTALMESAKNIRVYPGFALQGYGNRDSSIYAERYHIPEAKDIIRGTLRYQGNPQLMKALVSLGFLSTDERADLAKDVSPAPQWNTIMGKLLESADLSPQALQKAVVAKAGLAPGSEEARTVVSGMAWLGLFSDVAATPRGNLLDTFCALLEQKLQYGPGERDCVVLQHTFDVSHADGSEEVLKATAVWYGEPNGYSAMARTVGVPAGLATRLILDGKITEPGVRAPMEEADVTTLLEAVEAAGIGMVETREPKVYV